MMEPTETDKVYQRLVKAKMGSRIFFDPAKRTVEEWSFFIECCKQFIRDNYGLYWDPQFYIEISNDGQSVRKFEYFQAKEKKTEK